MPKLPGSFQSTTQAPIDGRTVVADTAARDAISLVYEGLVTFVVAEQQEYIYTSNGWIKHLPESISDSEIIAAVDAAFVEE